MKQKLFLTIFLFLVFFNVFGVKKSWATVCCSDPNTHFVNDNHNMFGGCCINNDSDSTSCIASPGTNVSAWNCQIGDYCNADNTCIGGAVLTPGFTPFVSSVVSSSPASPFDPCKNLTGTKEDECRACTGIDTSGAFNVGSPCDTSKYHLGNACGTWTSLGCIPNDPPNLVGWILGLGSGIAGGIAFLLILFGAGQIVLSGGVPEKIAAGKEIITSAVIGLVFIFVSVLVLQIIGVKILGIPGWS